MLKSKFMGTLMGMMNIYGKGFRLFYYLQTDRFLWESHEKRLFSAIHSLFSVIHSLFKMFDYYFLS